MRNGRDAKRRNRNIGTEKQGYGKDNELIIPTCGSVGNHYWEKLVSFKAVVRKIGNLEITFIVEKTRKDSCHACTVDDICLLLKHIPEDDLFDLPLIILRQPKHKEELLKPVWGRYIYYAEIGKYKGTAIMLEACSYKKSIVWSNSLIPDEAVELERLRQDGHQMTQTKRHYKFLPILDTVRTTQLYRTLLHEIGHNVDFTNNDFTNKTSKDKELFAHSYADKMKKQLTQEGIIPFNRMLNLEQMKEDCLDINDFLLPVLDNVS